jgi:hypothetical protein
MTPSGAAATLLAARPRQPDQRSCGAACLVVERALRDPAYAELLVAGRHPVTGWTLPGRLEDRFAAEVLAMHRRTTGPVSLAGRLQLPWPRGLGTPPWAIAGQLGTGRQRWRVRPFLSRRTPEGVVAAVDAGQAVPVFVGSRWLPRHVVLALDVEHTDGHTDGHADGRTEGAPVGVWCYDPASGRVSPVRLIDLDRRRVDLSGWRVAWWAVLPS